MKYHVAIDLPTNRLMQLRILAIKLNKPICKLVAQIIDEYLVSQKIVKED